MKFLVTGAQGQLGSEVVRCFRGLGHTVVAPGKRDLNLLRPDQIRQTVSDCRPDWVINCAAYTQVDRAESEAATAFRINRDGAEYLAQAVARCGGRLLHVSTDYVFDGQQDRPYRESDVTGPKSVYGRSKLAGEEAVLAALPAAIVLRTAWVYGVRGRNFVKTMLRLAATGKTLRVVDDQKGSPTAAADIAQAIAGLTNCSASGVYHFTAAGETTWYGFAVAILEEARRIGFRITTQSVVPISTAEYPVAATRPACSVLDTTKIQPCLARPAPAWRDSLRTMLGELYTCADCW
ncbi:MAG TPA: dTDP-4-dehydrorhamnose reductase [Gammaproteobacteria bacterium]|nr:dTDP-4-dehydrorhamnose reductase [Gammaproteobacteria bacterium]